MKTRSGIFLFATGALFFGMSPTTLAKTPSSIQIEMDKGELTLDFSKLDSDYTLSSSFPEKCKNSEIQQTYKNHRLKLVHVGETCSEGAHVQITLNKEFKKVSASLDSGLARVAAAAQLLKEGASVNAAVQAGQISSKLLKVTRTSNFAGATGATEGPEKPKALDLDIQVKAGLIEF